jgi:hypothetical protein
MTNSRKEREDKSNKDIKALRSVVKKTREAYKKRVLQKKIKYKNKG